jgi:hypothetical protein
MPRWPRVATLVRAMHKRALTVNSIPPLASGICQVFQRTQRLPRCLAGGLWPNAAKGHVPERFFRLSRSIKFVGTGKAAALLPVHSVAPEWQCYSAAVAVASRVKDQREDGQCCGHVGGQISRGSMSNIATMPSNIATLAMLLLRSKLLSEHGLGRSE